MPRTKSFAVLAIAHSISTLLSSIEQALGGYKAVDSCIFVKLFALGCPPQHRGVRAGPGDPSRKASTSLRTVQFLAHRIHAVVMRRSFHLSEPPFLLFPSPRGGLEISV